MDQERIRSLREVLTERGIEGEGASLAFLGSGTKTLVTSNLKEEKGLLSIMLENPEGTLEGLKRVLAGFGAMVAPGVSQLVAGKEALSGENVTEQYMGEEPRKLADWERVVAGAGVVPALGMLKMHGIGKSLLLASKFGGPDKVSMFLEGLRIPQKDWSNVKDVISEGTAFWRGPQSAGTPKSALNIGREQRTGIISHEMTHERFDYPQDAIEKAITDRIEPAASKLLRAHHGGVFKGSPNVMDFWLLSPEEQTAMYMERAVAASIRNKTPFNFGNTFIEASRKGEERSLAYMENYLGGAYGKVPEEAAEVVRETLSLQKRLLGGSQKGESLTASRWRKLAEPEISGERFSLKAEREALEAPVGKAEGSFAQTYPTFEAYSARMKEMGIPLEILAAEKGKSTLRFVNVPANEEEYLARIVRERLGGD